MADTFESLWRGVLLRCPSAGPFLARDWINWSLRRIAETRRWSWLQKQSQFLATNVENGGLVNVTTNDPVVTGVGTTWDGSETGKQFRVGLPYPIATVMSVDDIAQTLTLDIPFGGLTLTSTNYSIFSAYFTAPSDFHAFISLWDPAYNWQLWTNVQQEELNMWDSQRANQGTAWVVSFRDYDPLAAVGEAPLPRYELWPHQMSAKPYPFLYESRVTDLVDGGVLPKYIRGDVLMEGALAQCAKWPGTNDYPNPYFNLQLSQFHESSFRQQVFEMERQDDETAEQDVRYANVSSMPWAVVPWMDAKFLQSHAF